MKLEMQLERLGYERVEYNGGAFCGYRKCFNGVKDVHDIKAACVEVRFREHRDWEFMAYLRFPSFYVALPGLKEARDIEGLRRLLTQGSNV